MRANVRVFWYPDHVREWRLADGSRTTDTTTLTRQPRYSRSADFPESATRSTGAAIQELYDRGAGWDDASSDLWRGDIRHSPPTLRNRDCSRG
jgi:hypothetical protein